MNAPDTHFIAKNQPRSRYQSAAFHDGRVNCLDTVHAAGQSAGHHRLVPARTADADRKLRGIHAAGGAAHAQCPAIGFLLLAIDLGPLSDRFDRRPVLLCGLLACICAPPGGLLAELFGWTLMRKYDEPVQCPTPVKAAAK